MTPISDETAHMCRQKGKKILYSCFCTNISHNLRIKGLYFCFQVQKTELAYLVWFRFNNSKDVKALKKKLELVFYLLKAAL